jgi:hypothetical protein
MTDTDQSIDRASDKSARRYTLPVAILAGTLITATIIYIYMASRADMREPALVAKETIIETTDHPVSQIRDLFRRRNAHGFGEEFSPTSDRWIIRHGHSNQVRIVAVTYLSTSPRDIASEEDLDQVSRGSDPRSRVVYDAWAHRIRDDEIAAIALVYIEFAIDEARRGRDATSSFDDFDLHDQPPQLIRSVGGMKLAMIKERRDTSGPYSWSILRTRAENGFWLGRMSSYASSGLDDRMNTTILTDPLETDWLEDLVGQRPWLNAAWIDKLR